MIANIKKKADDRQDKKCIEPLNCDSIQILDRKLEGLNVSNYTTKNMPFKKILNMFLINKKLVLFNFERG